MKINISSNHFLIKKSDCKDLFKIMKICLLFLFAFTFQLLALNSKAQDAVIELKTNSVTIGQLINEIEKQTDYLVVYSNREVDTNRKVNFPQNSDKVSSYLKTAFSNTDIGYNFENDYIVLSKKAHQNTVDITHRIEATQQEGRTITGKVTDSTGAPLPGVTVVLMGTTQGTITDPDGHYSLSDVASDATLVFSFVGMKTQEISVASKSTIDVTMEEDAIVIEEVVAIGYGTMKKSDLTGSVVRANIKTFSEAPNTSIMQSLQGTVPGLNVGPTSSQGQDPSLSIRGSNNLGGSSDHPLIVVDGAIYNASLSDLNPSDIESVDILKDASSAAIYGASAANGVIIITTKRGTGGKPLFSYSTKYTMQSAADLLTPLDREGFLQQVNNSRFKDAYLAPDYIQPNPDYNITEDWGVYQKLIKGYEEGADYNWMDMVIRDGSIMEHNLSMRQKTKNTSYYISGGYTKSEGIVDNDDYKRYSVRMNMDNQLKDWLKIGLQSFVTSADYSGVNPEVNRLSYMSPLEIPYLENGDIDPYMSASLVNPLYYKKIDNEDKRFNLFANAYAQIDVPWIEGLSYKLAYTNTYRALENYTYDPSGKQFQGSATKQHDFRKGWQLDNTLNYKKTFNKVHDVNITVVAGRKYDEGTGTNATSAIFALPGLKWNRLEDGAIEEQKTSSSAWDENNIYYMARGFYSYKSKYLLTATIRRDGYSSFGADNKWGVFPSAAVGWVFNNEDFVNLSWLDYGKLRLSYGKNGSNTVSRYSTLARISSGFDYNFEDKSAFYIAPASLSSSELKWETTTGLNLALDFNLFDYRLGGTLEYYNTKTEDILYNIRIPNITGFDSQTTNIGQVNNWGIEATLNTVNIRTKNFTWNSTFSFSRNRSSVESVLGKDDDGDGKEDDLISSGLFIGEPQSAIYTYNYQGIYQLGDDDIPSNSEAGLYRWEDISGPDGEPDGVISPTYDRKIIGYSAPAYRWSLLNEFKYKNFSLMVFINSIQGGKDSYYANNQVLHGLEGINTLRHNGSVEAADKYWSPTNTNAIFRQLYQPDPFSNARYFQRSFVRLQDVSISYDMPKALLTDLGVSELKLFASGKNLYTWTKWMGGDPELGHGLSQSYNPLLRTFTLGLNLTF